MKTEWGISESLILISKKGETRTDLIRKLKHKPGAHQ